MQVLQNMLAEYFGGPSCAAWRTFILTFERAVVKRKLGNTSEWIDQASPQIHTTLIHTTKIHNTHSTPPHDTSACIDMHVGGSPSMH